MKKILFISRKAPVKFRELDIKILSSEYKVDRFDFKFNPISLFQLFWCLKNYDLAFCWFAGLWSFWAVLFSKIWNFKTIIVAGGFDVANVPEINYGLPQTRFHKYYAKYALKNADSVIAVSETNNKELLNFVKPKRHIIIYNGISCSEPKKNIPKKKQVLTVGVVNKISSLRKGHFRFIEVAKYLPEYKFLLAGKNKDRTLDILQNNSSDNVEFLGFVDDNKLNCLFNETKVYLQLSYHEAFGMSVVESMWYGCTPIVSDCGALPEIVYRTGIVIKNYGPKIVADKIKNVLENYPDFNIAAIERAKEFTYEIRKEKLLEEVDYVLNESK